MPAASRSLRTRPHRRRPDVTRGRGSWSSASARPAPTSHRRRRAALDAHRRALRAHDPPPGRRGVSRGRARSTTSTRPPTRSTTSTPRSSTTSLPPPPTTARCCTPCRAPRACSSAPSTCSSPIRGSTSTSSPALSFLDLAWVRLGVDPLEEGVRLVDGHRVRERAAGERGPLLVAHCHSRASAVGREAGLRRADPPERAVVLQRLGLPDEAVTEVAWADLDRAVEPDHLTVAVDPGAGRAGRGRAGAVRRARAHAAGAMPVGPRADPPASLARHLSRRPTRCSRPSTPSGQTASATTRSRRSWATCFPGRVPRHARRRARRVHAGRRRPRHPRQARAPPPPRVRRRRRTPARCGQLGGAQAGGEGPGQRDGRHPGDLPALLYAEGAGRRGGRRCRRRELRDRAAVPSSPSPRCALDVETALHRDASRHRRPTSRPASDGRLRSVA